MPVRGEPYTSKTESVAQAPAPPQEGGNVPAPRGAPAKMNLYINRNLCTCKSIGWVVRGPMVSGLTAYTNGKFACKRQHA